MKKWILSIALIFFFVVYSVNQRKEMASIQLALPTKVSPTSSVIIGTASPTPAGASRGQYKDGTFTGSVADAFYGNIQVQAIIQNGKITDVQFLQFPNDRSTSVEINQQAMPLLKQEAIQAQSAQVDVVSGATDSSQAFVQSLGNALAQAKG